MTLSLTDLSPRKRQVAELVGEGLSYQAIARRLANLRSFQRQPISVSTVKMHVAAIAEKIGDDDVPPKVRVMLWMRAQAA